MKLLIIIFIIYGNILLSDDLLNAEKLFAEGKYYEAKLIYEQIIDKSEKEYYLGYEIYYMLDDLQNAKDNIQLAILENEKYYKEGEELGVLITDINNATVTLTNGFVDDSIEEFKSLLKKHPNNAIINSRIGFAYQEKKDYDNAIIYLIKAKNISPYNKKYLEMIESIVKIQVVSGKEEYDRQDYQLALDFYNKALSYDSTYAPVMYLMGNLYYKLTDYQMAINMYKKGLKHTDLSPNKYQRLYQLGRFYSLVNNNEKAIDSYNKSLDLQPSYPKPLFEKAKIYKNLGKIDESKILLLQITDIDPTFTKSYELLMDIETNIKNYDKALDYGTMCLDFNEESYSVLSRMANIYNELNDYSKAKDYSKKSLKYCKDGRKQKQCAPAYFELAISEMNLCNKIAAEDAFSKAGRYDKRLYSSTTKTYIKNLDSYMKECD